MPDSSFDVVGYPGDDEQQIERAGPESVVQRPNLIRLVNVDVLDLQPAGAAT